MSEYGGLLRSAHRLRLIKEKEGHARGSQLPYPLGVLANIVFIQIGLQHLLYFLWLQSYLRAQGE